MRLHRGLFALVVVTGALTSLSPASPAGAVVGGSDIPLSSLGASGPFGWLAELDGPGGGCTGSLIHPQWILTAAHCSEIGLGADTITARIGDDPTDRAITEVHTHPQWDGELENDVALMRLAEPVSRTPVQFAESSDDLTSGQTLTLAGWGLTSVDGAEPTAPSSGTGRVEMLTSTTVATLGPAIGCSGDSGGPMLSGAIVVGVISSSDANCAEFTIGQRVHAFRTWIRSFISPGNQPPVALSGTIEATAGEAVDVRLEFSDPDGDPVEIVSADFGVFDTSNLECTAATDQDFTCTLTPPPSFVGTTVVSYTVADSGGLRATGRWEITYTRVAQPPIAEDMTITATAERATAFDLIATDPAGEPLTFQIVDGPDHGTVEGCESGSCVYTGDLGYEGPDTIVFVASNGSMESAPATVSIDVIPNRAPVAESAAYQVTSGVPTGFPLPASDPNGDALTFTVQVSASVNGTLTGCESGFCEYTSSPGFTGDVAFEFVASDGTLTSEPATVVLEVIPNLPPTVADVSVSTKAGQPVQVFLAASDPEGDTLTHSITSGPAHGSITDCSGGQCVYTPQSGYVGVDALTYTASDGQGTSEPAVVTIQVIGSSWAVTPSTSTTDSSTLAEVVTPDGAVSGSSLIGASSAIGTFEGADSVLGIDSGLVLSTGRAADVLGPNMSRSVSTVHDLPGDDVLTGIAGADTFDAVVLEFDVTPTSDTVQFRYVLASDEYTDGGFVTAEFNDSAEISIGGQQCSLADGSSLSVRSIRRGWFDLADGSIIDDPQNDQFYIDNSTATIDIESNGHSTVQICSVAVTPGAPVRVRIAIADGGDGGIDSVLLVEGDLRQEVDPLAALEAAVAGTTTSLRAKVGTISSALAAGRTTVACNVLNAFVNEVNARSRRPLPAAQAAELTRLADTLAASIPCPRRR